tara:strand:+ start:215 stop:418 length:204 start_codon:yes stop_codon:yes gene_type:complete
LDALLERPLDDCDVSTSDAQHQRPVHQATLLAADTSNPYLFAIAQVSHQYSYNQDINITINNIDLTD